MQLADYDTTRRYKATVYSSRRISPEGSDEVRELILDVEKPAFHYTVGQSIGVLLPGTHDIGHEHHFRLYTLSDLPVTQEKGQTRIALLVKRCDYIDDYSGERYKGIASNYLCNLTQGDNITVTGPYRSPFSLPDDKAANLLMIGMGTGIAPFRAFVRHIYDELGGWSGQVRLFYGARTGLELYYMNEHENDFSNYYDEKTFQAFQAVSKRPNWNGDNAIAHTLAENEKEVWDLLCHHNTYVYVAGLRFIALLLDSVFADMAGAQKHWQQRKAELIAGGRWSELIY